MRNLLLLLLRLSVSALSITSLKARDIAPQPEKVSTKKSLHAADAGSAALQRYAKLPLSFERRSNAEFVARGQEYIVDIHGPRATIGMSVSSTVGMEFVNGRQTVAIPEKELPGKVNYILGKDPRQWRLALPTYERITYQDLYSGIDIAYYGNQLLRANPESAVTKLGRESEVAKVPTNFGITGGREGPLLSSSERNRERQPDCPRKERLNPGVSQRSAKRPYG